MGTNRTIREVFRSKPTLEGAGVHLKRAFGLSEVPQFDPFLLLDDFRSDHPAHYLQGFPWHPHRGIETITYVLRGQIEHGDSLGNAGRIDPGDVQWMTAGSGIIHQEMPAGDATGRLAGFQLWANLPASHKMMAPRYREVKGHQIPQIVIDQGVHVRIISGAVQGTRGPVQDIITEPEYLDVTIPAGAEFIHATPVGNTVAAYVIEGKAYFCHETPPSADEVARAKDCDPQREAFMTDGSLVLFNPGGQIVVSTEDTPARFLLLSGKPIGEPVAWHGPIVMNTRDELQVAFDEYREGTFIKHREV